MVVVVVVVVAVVIVVVAAVIIAVVFVIIIIVFGAGTSTEAGGQTCASPILTMSGQVRASGTIATYLSTRFELVKVVVVVVAAADAVPMQLRELNPTHATELLTHIC